MRLKTFANLLGDRLMTLPLVVLYLTDGCNSRCQSCDIWRNPRFNMPIALAESIIAACEELGIRHVLLSGGEAMQHPDWPRIARGFREQGVHVMLLTNGLLLRKQADDVVNSVDEVIVSLDGGTAATYHQLRGVDAFDLVLEGIDTVRSAGLPVTTRTTVQRGNFRELPQIVDVALAHDVTTISFLAVDVSNPEAFGEREAFHDGVLTATEVDELESVIERITERDDLGGRLAESPEKLHRTLVTYFRALHGDEVYPAPRCNAPHFSTVIEADGRLRPCYFLPAYGRLQPDGDRLPQAINWQAAQDLRKAYRSGQRQECQRCVCPLYKGPRALLRM